MNLLCGTQIIFYFWKILLIMFLFVSHPAAYLGGLCSLLYYWARNYSCKPVVILQFVLVELTLSQSEGTSFPEQISSLLNLCGAVCTSWYFPLTIPPSHALEPAVRNKCFPLSGVVKCHLNFRLLGWMFIPNL